MFTRFGMFQFLQSRYKSLLLVVLVSLFLMQRGGLLLSGYSHIAHPGFDETASGVLACDLFDRQIRAPLFIYQYEARSGDGLIEGFLLVPFFKLFGRSLFSLKVLALSSAFLCLLCWIILIKRYHGAGAAILFTALFAFPPPMFARLNLTGTIGSHHLINPLMAVQLLFLFWIVEGDKNKRAPWLWLGFGLLSGLGAYTFYTYIIFDGFCFLFLLIFKSKTITFRRILLFSGGFLTGFSPWVLRSLSSPAGGGYLASILKEIKIDMWSFIQNFGFNLPHSFGYNYPSRNIGFISPLFLLFILFLSIVIVKNIFHHWSSLRTGSLRNKLKTLPPSTLQGIFFVIFPLFFLSCLSLSPMKIRPFEYWPTIGFFGNFSCADVYRYRWLHSLFPFYFVILAVGISVCVKPSHKNKTYAVIATTVLIFFLLWGVLDSVKLYSKNDFGKLFYYKGYSYDQMGNRFMLGDISRLDKEKALQFTLSYPKENRGEAYRCLGTTIALGLLDDADAEEKMEQSLQEIPSPYVNDFIYGVVRAAQNISEKEFQPFKRVAARRFPADFYKNWGFRHLGYKYYDLLLNREKILKCIPSLERWFFKDLLKDFKQTVQGKNREFMDKRFMDEMSRFPIQHQPEVVRGLGMLVGAEMLFDPMLSPNYPLDSQFGEMLSSGLQEAFYEGVGAGFTETLSRFLRRLLLPEDKALPLYEKMIDIEWERCYTLLSKVSPPHSALIKRGFLRELQERCLDDGIRKYLENKINRKNPNVPSTKSKQ